MSGNKSLSCSCLYISEVHVRRCQEYQNIIHHLHVIFWVDHPTNVVWERMIRGRMCIAIVFFSCWVDDFLFLLPCRNEHDMTGAELNFPKLDMQQEWRTMWPMSWVVFSWRCLSWIICLQQTKSYLWSWPWGWSQWILAGMQSHHWLSFFFFPSCYPNSLMQQLFWCEWEFDNSYKNTNLHVLQLTEQQMHKLGTAYNVWIAPQHVGTHQSLSQT